MKLGEFKTYIESLPDNAQFDYSISEPFSWRGAYNEVAFSIKKERSSKEEVLRRINLAYTETFTGYKGGKYRYNDQTDINFESDYGAYTDKVYVSTMISKIEKSPMFFSLEEKLVKLAFSIK